MLFNKFIASLLPYFPKKFIWLFSKKYIAGETIEDAIKKASHLNATGMKVSIDLLGEFVSNLYEAKRNKEAYLNIIKKVEKHKIDGNYSLKPTMFGMLIDEDYCYRNIREIVMLAAQYNNFIRLDMEDSQCVELEIELFKKLRREFPENIGIAFQAYLHRTHTDLAKLILDDPIKTSINIRICKGIYNEPEKIAYKQHSEINSHFVENLEFLIKHGCYPAIATHDKEIIEKALLLIHTYALKNEQFEFQMLYGVTPELRRSLVQKGYTMRVYVPFGKEWFGYSTRRLRENPKMVSHIIKAIFVKK